ncbi:unnamed protein product [Rotaria socialis]|uniref:Uncharacterized protein n=1 Tax=Rotaria socialis TaxID=392032 RepID=A0A821BAT7_9BILA|nr:unnamed protein product [Rotaria socialis]
MAFNDHSLVKGIESLNNRNSVSSDLDWNNKNSQFNQNIPQRSTWLSENVQIVSKSSSQRDSCISASSIKSNAWSESTNVYTNANKSIKISYSRPVLKGLILGLLVGCIVLATIITIWLQPITTTTSSTSTTSTTTTTTSTTSTTTTTTQTTSTTTTTTTTTAALNIVYSQSFTSGVTPSSACTAWTNFVAQLTPLPYTLLQMNGTYDSVGVTITDSTVIAAIAVALRTAAAYGPVTTNGRSWQVGACGTGSELSAAGSICMCPSPDYLVRPCIVIRRTHWLSRQNHCFNSTMHNQIESQHYLYTPRIYVDKRPLHWFIMFISYLFIFLLVLESVALIVLGAWHLTTPRLENVLKFSSEIYRRELGFGILLVIIGSLGIIASIIGIIALITSRILLLKIYVSCLWLFMILGIAIGIIGIIFASQVNDFLANDQKNNPNLVASNYYQEQFLLGMNGGLTLLMSVTILVGIIILHCLISDTSSGSNASSFDLTLNINGKNSYFRFFETITSIENLRMPSVIILADSNDQSANIVDSSFIQIYRTQSNGNLFHIATICYD